MTSTETAVRETWPELSLDAWEDTRDTLHMWTQVVGKVRMALSPRVNHWWHTPLYVNPRGLTTGTIPYGTRTFQIDFDFLDHRLRILDCLGGARMLALRPMTVAQFHSDVMELLRGMDVRVQIWTTPVEVQRPIPFEQDTVHAAYDPVYAQRFWRALLQADRVLNAFRSRFIGKCSPVHFFWGSFDLAVTRFSGREAPPHPGGVPNLADWVTREAYSHEVSSAGWWPGGGDFRDPAFYAYMYPEPEGYADAPVRPEAAYYHPQMREFILPYPAVCASADPDRAVMDFLQSTYERGAALAAWDRRALEAF
ncbi:MAG TPA: DUF5996 family protein [Longimicrobium sp.]|jgi:hypothetical protein|uniref:DUF5996 family protein n=1 Tax=Longimicrobium sp. TaxID=2029185 RepID=UPI002EDA9078